MLQKLIDAVRECSRIMLSADRSAAHTETKGGRFNNLVTDYDKRMQAALQERLMAILPEAHFVGEEEDIHDSIETGLAFIVDPIDGTTNFVKDYKASTISVAVTKDGEQYLGIVYNPYLDEVFYAEKGTGAFCNGKPIHVSDMPLHQGLMLFGSASYYEELIDESFRMLRHYFDRSMDIRRSGSAAWDLCCIAAGRAELYSELLLQPWDYAAGSLIVAEAGGTVTQVDGTPIDLTRGCSILAYGTGVAASDLYQPEK
ncbi:MAG: inositol monophosphatase family protein [Butyricicoccaceae bacterium]